MTSHEIMNADVLDILFENRNKQYGAYRLRRNYPRELGKALGIALSPLLLLYFLFPSRSKPINPEVSRAEVKLISLDMPPIEQPKPPVKARPTPTPKVATSSFTAQLKVTQQPDPRHQMEDHRTMLHTALGPVNEDGPEAGLVQAVGKKPESGTQEGGGETTSAAKEFVPVERMPEFPGGNEAWIRFLNKNLRTPDDLMPGEKKVVQVSFQVDKDGSITNFHVIQSGGRMFDEEVIRVLRKMPRWIPALQNGQGIPVSFTQPVTFIGME